MRKYLQNETSTIQRRETQHKKGIISTTERTVPVTLGPQPKVEEICTKFIDLTGMSYAYQRGRFLARPESSNNYLIVLYEYIATTIIAELMPHRK